MKRSSDVFKKYLHNPAEASRMADDIGNIRGIMGYKQFYDGKFVKEVKGCNTITNLSKSTVIRLLGCGTSPWITGSLVQSDFAIAKMRFGNNTLSALEAERKYLYYDITEEPKFDVATVAGIGVGGDISKTTYGSGFSTSGIATSITKRNTLASDGYLKVESSGDSGSTHRYKTYSVLAAKRPPSQYTLKVDFLIGTTVVETVYFNSAHNWLSTGSKIIVNPYTRSSTGSPATKIVTTSGYSQIIYRGSDTALVWNIDPYATSQAGSTMLYYDYTEGSNGTWKLLIDEHNAASYETIKVSYMTGKHNIINNIIPKSGYNRGSGTSISDRYTSSTGDSYSIVSTREYRDCDTDYIDDYAVTFAVNMTSSDGNGNASAEQSQELQYTQAYLFNGRDEVFSAIQLSSDNAFSKNSKYAYYITWQLLASIN